MTGFDERKVALCTIGRLENRYAKEFVQHYLSLCFDKIFIYDNNHDNEEHFEDVLGEYVNSGKVQITNYRNKIAAQHAAYNDCYAKHGGEYGWMAFFDFDEFLVLPKHNNNVRKFLSEFPSNAQIVQVNWMIMTDNNLVRYDNRPVMERFTEPMDKNRPIGYSFPENRHVKSIVRGGLGYIGYDNAHAPSRNLTTYHANGKQVSKSYFQDIDWSVAHLKHFTTKTIEEFITNKYRKGVGDRDFNYFTRSYPYSRFFKYNERTPEKMAYIKSLGMII